MMKKKSDGMYPPDLERKNMVLDEIILERRTYRRFTDEFPSDEMITGIIEAGLHAPYAGAAVTGEEEYFRRFFVVRKDSKTMAALKPFVFDEVLKMASGLELAVEKNEQLGVQAAGFMERLSAMKKMGFVPGVGSAPFYIIVAEKKGFPPVEQESLAHCLENMWLKATALGLGFQLVSATSQMGENENFCTMLGLQKGEWGFMGCAVGFPQEKLPRSVRPPVKDVVEWME